MQLIGENSDILQGGFRAYFKRTGITMEDQGEKIVFLARELLEANAHQQEPVATKKMTVTMTFKTLCFTTILAAATGNIISTLVHQHTRPLNRYEKIELKALVFYAAKLKQISEDLVREEVERELKVDSFEEITAKNFTAARRFLQEQAN
jgi:hypothetical protein